MSIYKIILASTGIIPGLIWLIIFLYQDKKRPEPNRMIVKAFLYGMAITPIAALAEALFLPLFLLPTLLIAAPVEEFLKYKIFSWTIKKNPNNNEPIDPMIYMITIALGFASVENIVLVFHGNGLFGDTFGLLLLRFLSATLIHALCSATIGYCFSQDKYNKTSKLKVIHGMLFAIFVHAVYNYTAWQSSHITGLHNVFGLSLNLWGMQLFGLLTLMFIVVSYQFKKIKQIDY